MKLRRGLYEQIINQYFQFNLKKEVESIKIEKEKMGNNDSIKNLSDYISNVTYKALEHLKNTNTINPQIQLINKMIKSIVESTDDQNFKDYLISEEAEMLLPFLITFHKIMKTQISSKYQDQQHHTLKIPYLLEHKKTLNY